jgi:hypothetical protein
MRCIHNPFDGDDPDLSFPFSPNAPVPEQVANLLFRFQEYRKLHRNIKASLDSVSHHHYKNCDMKILLELKQPIQVFLFARESLVKIDEALAKDIAFCESYLINLQNKESSGE